MKITFLLAIILVQSVYSLTLDQCLQQNLGLHDSKCVDCSICPQQGCKFIDNQCQPLTLDYYDLIDCIQLGPSYTYSNQQCIDCSSLQNCDQQGCTLQGSDCVAIRSQLAICAQKGNTFFFNGFCLDCSTQCDLNYCKQEDGSCIVKEPSDGGQVSCQQFGEQWGLEKGICVDCSGYKSIDKCEDLVGICLWNGSKCIGFRKDSEYIDQDYCEEMGQNYMYNGTQCINCDQICDETVCFRRTNTCVSKVRQNATNVNECEKLSDFYAWTGDSCINCNLTCDYQFCEVLSNVGCIRKTINQLDPSTCIAKSNSYAYENYQCIDCLQKTNCNENCSLDYDGVCRRKRQQENTCSQELSPQDCYDVPTMACIWKNSKCQKTQCEDLSNAECQKINDYICTLNQMKCQLSTCSHLSQHDCNNYLNQLYNMTFNCVFSSFENECKIFNRNAGCAGLFNQESCTVGIENSIIRCVWDYDREVCLEQNCKDYDENDELNGWYCLNGEEKMEISCQDLDESDCKYDSNGLECIWDNKLCRIKNCNDLDECDDTYLNGQQCYLNVSMKNCERWDGLSECSDIGNESLCNNQDSCYWYNSICYTYQNVIDCQYFNDEQSCLSQLFCQYNQAKCSNQICYELKTPEQCNKYAFVQMSSYNCYWQDDQCKKYEKITCEVYKNNQTICQQAKCIYNNGDCLDKITDCSELVNQTSCNYALFTPAIESDVICQWYDNKCIKVNNRACNQIFDQSLCNTARLVNQLKCVWYNKKCAKLDCSLYNTQLDCLPQYCIWKDDSCQSDQLPLKECSDPNSQDQCEFRVGLLNKPLNCIYKQSRCLPDTTLYPCQTFINLQCTHQSIYNCQQGWDNNECVQCVGLTEIQCNSSQLACTWQYDMCFPKTKLNYSECIQSSPQRAWSSQGCINCWEQIQCTGPCRLQGKLCVGRRLEDSYYQLNLLRCQSVNIFYYKLNGFNSSCFKCEDCLFNTYQQCIEKGYYYGFDSIEQKCVDCSQFKTEITCSPLICNWDINCHGLRLGDPTITIDQCYQYGQGYWKFDKGVCSPCDPNNCHNLCHRTYNECKATSPSQIHTYELCLSLYPTYGFDIDDETCKKCVDCPNNYCDDKCQGKLIFTTDCWKLGDEYVFKDGVCFDCSTYDEQECQFDQKCEYENGSCIRFRDCYSQCEQIKLRNECYDINDMTPCEWQDGKCVQIAQSAKLLDNQNCLNLTDMQTCLYNSGCYWDDINGCQVIQASFTCLDLPNEESCISVELNNNIICQWDDDCQMKTCMSIKTQEQCSGQLNGYYCVWANTCTSYNYLICPYFQDKDQCENNGQLRCKYNENDGICQKINCMDYSYDKCEQDLDCYLKNNDCIELPDKISCEIFETKQACQMNREQYQISCRFIDNRCVDGECELLSNEIECNDYSIKKMNNNNCLWTDGECQINNKIRCDQIHQNDNCQQSLQGCFWKEDQCIKLECYQLKSLKECESYPKGLRNNMQFYCDWKSLDGRSLKECVELEEESCSAVQNVNICAGIRFRDENNCYWNGLQCEEIQCSKFPTICECNAQQSRPICNWDYENSVCIMAHCNQRFLSRQKCLDLGCQWFNEKCVRFAINDKVGNQGQFNQSIPVSNTTVNQSLVLILPIILILYYLL